MAEIREEMSSTTTTADIDNKQQREKELEAWLPITSSRNAKWWYSAFHNVTAIVGAGVLSLPYAMSQLGWGPGIAVLSLSWIITLYTLWQMVEMHELVPGKRFDRYHELCQHAFGEKLGLYIVIPQQLMVQVGSDIVYMVTGGKSLQKAYNTLCTSSSWCKDIRLTYWIMIFAAPHLFISQLPNFNSIWIISLAAAVMSITYSTIAWTTTLHKGIEADVQYGPRSSTTPGMVFDFLSALGNISFAYAAHSVVLEIQATIPSTPQVPSKKPMWKGVLLAYFIVAACYFPVALIGYRMFGNTVQDNILISLEKPAWLIGVANLFVFVHVVGSYQVFAVPVFDQMETFMVKKMRLKPSLRLRVIGRSLYVGLTMFIGMSFPFFGGLLGFFGGFAFAPTTYFLPCIIWLIIFKPKRYSLSWFINWVVPSVTKIISSNIKVSLAYQPGMIDVIRYRWTHGIDLILPNVLRNLRLWLSKCCQYEPESRRPAMTSYTDIASSIYMGVGAGLGNFYGTTSPLGLTLTKTPSFLELVESKTSKKYDSTSADESSDESKKRKAAKNGEAEKLKASNISASRLRIGRFERESKNDGDLVAKCYYAKRKLVWEMLDGGLKNKIEINWSEITAIKAVFPKNQPSVLQIQLSHMPSFQRESDPQPRKHTIWHATPDFTGGQASVNR
ncbi:hypothetical protein Scep_021047 [Stephania cephalantha]|uniref:Amino acid transporter transmembrane domain-containing protein n=1 Tax=Stephania cephalantha TaxID=152367 RepID=A0AAP0HWH8_9MAGN